MFKKIFIAICVLMLLGISFNAVSANYVEQVNRSGDKILYRLVLTNPEYSNDERTLGYVWAKGAYHLNDAVVRYTEANDYVFKNWSYKDYTRKRYIRYDVIIIPNN